MNRFIRILALPGLLVAIATSAEAGGYHCWLKINDLKVVAEKTYELKVEKTQPDRALYAKQLGEWEMVKEPVGREFTLVFSIEKLDEDALTCLNFMIQAFKSGTAIEFGFAETAIKADGEGKYVSTLLDTWHANKRGEPCVHGN